MSTEMAGLTRRDLLFSYAKQKKAKYEREKQAPKTGSKLTPPPNNNENGINRRQALRWLIGGAIGLGAVAVGISRPWDQPDPEQPKSETLASLVDEAIKIEDEFQESDLSNKNNRVQYTNLLAQIFTKYYSTNTTANQLASTVIFSSKETINGSPAVTKDNKIYIDTSNDIFQKNKTSTKSNWSKGWNPLKSLRLTLFHEFIHEIVQLRQDQALFSVVDAQNNVRDKEISGFRVQGYDNKNRSVAIYDLIDEASVELLSKYINTDLFRSFISGYISKEGVDASAIMTRLEQVLNSAGISRTDLANFHQTSDLKGFLLLLNERYGISPQKIGEKDRITFGFSIFEALVQNNQAILQDYITSAKKLTK